MEKAVEDADRIRGVESGDKIIIGFFDGLHVTWGDVAGGTDQGEVFVVHVGWGSFLWLTVFIWLRLKARSQSRSQSRSKAF